MTEPAQSIITKDGQRWPDWKLQPPPADSPERMLGFWVWNKYQIMRRHRDKQQLPELWYHFHSLYRGRIFKYKSKYAQVIANLVWKTINALKAHLTDNKPRASIMPRGDTPDDTANGWQARYDIWWERTSQQGSLTQSVGRSELYGCQIDQMLFDPDQEGGLGEISTKRWDIFSVFCWPNHQEIQSQPMMCTIEPMELGVIADLWPEKAIDPSSGQLKVKADPEFSEMVGESRKWVRGNRSRNLRPMGLPAGFYIPEGEESPADISRGLQRALVVRLWCRDQSMMWVDPRTGQEVKGEKVLEMAEDGVTPVVVSEQWSRYPGFIRCITVTNKGQLVLADEANPSINPNLPREVAANCYLWDKFPFLKRLSYSDDLSEYGLSIVEQIETLVIEICKKLTMYGVHLDTQCRTPLILPQNCGVKRDNVSNLPARIWEPIISMAQQIRFLQVPQASGDIVPYIELCIKLVDVVTGIMDVSEGRRPSGVTAGVAIAALQEKAQTIFREKIRNIDLYLEEQGRMFISLGQNWYTEIQQLRYAGKTQEEEMIPFRGVESQGELAFHVESGSTLPRNRATRQQQMIELAKAGKITDMTLLKELEVPNADEEAAKLAAGPLGLAINKLRRSGMFTDQDLMAIEQIVTMDDKGFKQQFGSGNMFEFRE